MAKSKNHTLARERVAELLRCSASGNQVGLRDQFRKLIDAVGLTAARQWLQTHISLTLEFRKLLNDPTVLLGDTEATGFSPADEVCELSLVRLYDGAIVFDSLIKPTIPITAGAIGVHGITNEMVSELQSFADTVAPQAAEIGLYKVVYFYNEEFDRRLIEQSEYASSSSPNSPAIEWPEFRDILQLVAKWIGDWNKKQTGFKYAKLEGGHRALGDCMELARLVQDMASSDVEYAQKLYDESA